MKKIAVLLASYNGAEYIKDQVDSILNQKEAEVKIFVSDDLSTDRTVDYLQNIYKDEKRLVYLESNQKFGGAAKNF
ncbi:MAG: glycosyltransferase, partial [Arcobacteraceae bacterium]|nr:glycosyltransferase [Arcobacteraceae bacterium]